MRSSLTNSDRFQYPDPDHLDDVTRFPWVGEVEGDDADHVPSELLNASSFAQRGPFTDYDQNRDAPTTDLGNVSTLIIKQYQPVVANEFEPLHGDDESRISGRSVARPSVTRARVTRQADPETAPSGTSRKPRRGGRGNPGVKRGIRDPIEPQPEFKLLHSQATMAFIANDFDEAERLTLQALQINPEMFPAHNLLSQIHAARGDLEKAIIVAYNGAHTRPRDVEMWSRIARMLLERDQERSDKTLKDAVYCYNRIIAVDKLNLEARHQRATLNRELGKLRQVVIDYELLLKYYPHDTTVLRHLAHAAIEIDEPDRALKPYTATVAHYQGLEPSMSLDFSWSDINVLVELYIFSGKHHEGLEVAKCLSRWLLGRKGDVCWENFTEDDREWDLDDEPRRCHVQGFTLSRFEPQTYGDGLPLDLRIKLGMFRLHMRDTEEALQHFDWLDPSDFQIGAKVFDYPDLFRDVGRCLFEKGFLQDAIRFYEPLQHSTEYFDDACQRELDRCYAALEVHAAPSDITALENDTPLVDDAALDNDAILGEAVTLKTQAVLDRDVQAEENRPSTSQHSRGSSSCEEEIRRESSGAEQTEVHPNIQQIQSSALKQSQRRASEKFVQVDQIQNMVRRQEELSSDYRRERTRPTDECRDLSRHLVQVFLASHNLVKDQENGAERGWNMKEWQIVRRKGRSNESVDDNNCDSTSCVAKGLADVQYYRWLDLLLEYAMMLTSEGKARQAYEILASIAQLNAFVTLPDLLFLIQICWLDCALQHNDVETLCNVARWFMKECQFVTDAYRLLPALNRVAIGELGYFNSGPSQKHVLRQIKAMDQAVAARRGRLSSQQPDEPAGDAKEGDDGASSLSMNASLLMLYGNILYVGRSFAYANTLTWKDYYLRALAIDPANPAIKFSLAVSYIQHALKRQADNRHQLIMQGLALLFEYYACQERDGGSSEKQEGAYNVARVYHLLGLTHPATMYYELCLKLSQESHAESTDSIREDFALEAALALQGIWSLNGNATEAFRITEDWLQI